MNPILQAQRDYVANSGITVDIDRGLGTVDIAGTFGTIAYMQGDEGYGFIEAADELWEREGDIGMDDALLIAAYPYADIE